MIQNKKKYIYGAVVFLFVVGIGYGMIYLDVMSRGRSSFYEAKKFQTWDQNPEQKKIFFEKKYRREKKNLERDHLKGKLTRDEYEQDLEILRFHRDELLNESSIKNAYQWYRNTYLLFSPPETKWVQQSRLLAPMAKKRWREQLEEKNISFQEYMLGIEAGETPGNFMVYSTLKWEDAVSLKKLLGNNGIESVLFDSVSHGRLSQEGIKVIVPFQQFWEAHGLIKGSIETN